MTEGESTGTSVTFWADPKIFETTIYDFETLRSRFQQMAFLNKGLKISLTDERENDQAGDEVAGDAADEPAQSTRPSPTSTSTASRTTSTIWSRCARPRRWKRTSSASRPKT